jgi:hypothetical protein
MLKHPMFVHLQPTMPEAVPPPPFPGFPPLPRLQRMQVMGGLFFHGPAFEVRNGSMFYRLYISSFSVVLVNPANSTPPNSTKPANSTPLNC